MTQFDTITRYCFRAFLLAGGLFAIALFRGGEAQAQATLQQSAKRPPLIIVPEATRRALIGSGRGSAARTITPDGNLRGRPFSTRIVGQIPGTKAGMVEVGQLGALEESTIGLTRGLGADIWQGARQVSTVSALRRMPRVVRHASLRRLEKAVLHTRALAPIGQTAATSFFTERLTRLLEQGDVRATLALITTTGSDKRNARIARLKREALIASGNPSQACAEPDPIDTLRHYESEKRFFLKFRIFCHLRNNENAKAALGLELSSETLARQKLFSETAFLLAAGGAVTYLPKISSLPDIVDYLVIKLTNRPLPLVASAYPNYLMPALASDFTQKPIIQFGAAQRAAAGGMMPPEDLLEIARLINPANTQPARQGKPPDPQENEKKSSKRNRKKDVIVTPAMFEMLRSLRRIDATKGTRERAQTIQIALLAATNDGTWWRMASALGSYATTTIADENTRATALCLVPVALLANAPQRAELWFAEALNTRRDQIRLARNAIYRAIAYMHEPLGEAVGDSRFLPAINWSDFEAELETASPAMRDYLRAEMGVWLGVDSDLPESLEPFLAIDALSPRARRVLAFGAKRGLGELALNVVVEYGDTPFSEVTPIDIAVVTAHLRKHGLYTIADAFASEYLISRLAVLIARLEVNEPDNEPDGESHNDYNNE